MKIEIEYVLSAAGVAVAIPSVLDAQRRAERLLKASDGENEATIQEVQALADAMVEEVRSLRERYAERIQMLTLDFKPYSGLELAQATSRFTAIVNGQAVVDQAAVQSAIMLACLKNGDSAITRDFLNWLSPSLYREVWLRVQALSDPSVAAVDFFG